MTTTKFDVGDDVSIKAKIIGIGITKDGIQYDVRVTDFDGDTYTITCYEDAISSMRAEEE